MYGKCALPQSLWKTSILGNRSQQFDDFVVNGQALFKSADR
jgi:hypothetical protein